MMRHLASWALVVVLACCGSVWAQESTSGSIAGHVMDSQGATVPGATVTVTSGQGSRTFVTDTNGYYFAPFLVPGKYAVRVELAGFSPLEQKDIPVRLGQRLELDFTLKVGDLSEVVEVVGAAPVVDTTSTTAGGTLDSDVLKMLPVARNFTGTLYMVPGVSDSSGVGNANPSIGGASGLENNYIVDGVNISNAGFGGVGVYTIVFGSLGTGVTTDFIKETQVKTAGFEAEYGMSTGGVVNVVTKSGSNEFHGSVFGYFRPDALEAERNTVQSPNGTVNDVGSENMDFGVTLAGPVIQDKLFFFGAFNPQYQTRTVMAPEGFPLERLGEVDSKRRILAYAGKLTWQASANHRFDITAFGDPSKGEMGPQRVSALRAADETRYSELDYGGHNQAVRYDGILNSNWLVEASVSRAFTTFEEIPSTNEHLFTDRTVTPWARSGGLGYFDAKSDGTTLQFGLKSTHLFNAGGQHQVRYGVQYEDIEFTRWIDRTGPNFFLANGQETFTGASLTRYPDPVWGSIYRVTRANFGEQPVTEQKYLNFFLQDTWQIGRLTLKPGIRWEQQDLSGGQPICFAEEERVGDGHGTTPVNCEYTWTNNWGPRIGAIFDVTGDGRSKAYASWGRFYAKIPNDLAARSLAADAGITRGDYFDKALTQPVPEGVLALGATAHLLIFGAHPALFENDTRSTFHDEFVAGVEFDAGNSLNLGVRYIHRNLSTVLEDYAPNPIVWYEFGGGWGDYIIDNIGSDLETADDPAGIIPKSHFEDPVHKYDSVEFTATKAFSNNWSLLASYRWSKLGGNFEGFFRSDNGQSDPAITSLFDFPTNDISYTQLGAPLFGYLGDVRYQGTTLGEYPLPNERPHQIKIYGTYAWNDLNLGVGFNAGSGRYLTALAANPAYGNSGEIPVTGRGGGMETQDGFLEKTNADVVVDFHADYTLRLGDEQRLILIADFLNLLNNQDPTWYDVDYEATVGSLNPNFGYPQACGSCTTNAFRTPRQIRLGARFEW